MHPALLRIEDFSYHLPAERIAKYPLPERDQSRLLVYRQGNIVEDTYFNISNYIPSRSLLIFNQTKVVNARLLFKKATGAAIEVFCLEPHESYSDMQSAMLCQGTVLWKCMVGGAAKWKDGQTVQVEVTAGEMHVQVYADIVERKDGYFLLKIYWEPESFSFAEILHYAGQIPLPPYLNREAEEGDQSRYQTIFARDEGSVAAPTAALHFTDRILESLLQKEIRSAMVTLHVGAGTFKPVKSERMQDHDMHAEWIDVSVVCIEELMKQIADGLPVMAVGTTSARTLESLYWIGAQLSLHITPDFSGIAVPQWYPYEQDTEVPVWEALDSLRKYMLQSSLSRLVTRTSIIIAPGYQFRILNGLITNFHQPRSTLLLLVAALIGDSWRKVYEYALENDFRFLSYGDGCLLWRG